MKIEKIKQYLSLLKKIKDKELMHYASSLSFHTMLSLIPVLLISLTVFLRLPVFDVYYDRIKTFIFSSLLPTHQDILTDYIEKFIGNTLSLGIVGFVGILFTSLMFFMDYEYIINKIMKTQSRSFWQSLSSYWTMITLAPLGLAISFYLSGLLQAALNHYELTNWINFLAIFPYLVIWGLFFVTYMISINVNLSVKTVGIASFFASIIWYGCKTAFVYYVIYNKTYLSVYGSFSVVLFFFIWIYLSWIIFLYGVKLCYFLNKKERNNPNGNKTNGNSLEENTA